MQTVSRSCSLLFAMLLAAGCAGGAGKAATSPPSSPKSSSVKGPSGTAVGYVVVSVADLDAALDFWVNRL
ncbi:MAG: hypothetical protein WCE48_02835, partial [Steroidobacteraceae bacterium]